MATNSGELSALVRCGRVVSMGSKATVEADRLGPDDEVLPVVDIALPAGHVCEPSAPSYKVRRGRVERSPASRPLTAEERRVQVRERRATAYPAIGDQLDAIARAFGGLDPNSLPAETREWLGRLQAVKDAHPKE